MKEGRKEVSKEGKKGVRGKERGMVILYKDGHGEGRKEARQAERKKRDIAGMLKEGRKEG